MPDKMTTGERRALKTLPPIARDLIIAALAIAVSIAGWMFNRTVTQLELIQGDLAQMRVDWAIVTTKMQHHQSLLSSHELQIRDLEASVPRR